MRRSALTIGALVASSFLTAACGSDTSPGSASTTSAATSPGTAPTSTIGEAERWTPLPDAPIAGRIAAGSVWTGDELLIFGGVGRTGEIAPLADGAAYRPATHAWRRLAAPPDGVLGDVGSGAAWTGSVAVFWAGNSPDGPAAGALYDPAADSWQRLADGPLGPREGYASVWTGEELLIIGGAAGDGIAQPKAAAIDPATGRWRQLHGFDSLPGLLPAGAVWTDDEVIIPGSLSLCPERGSACSESRPILLAYDPGDDTVREIDSIRAPMSDADKHALVAVGWTGERVLLSSSGASPPRLFTYDPATDAWTAASAAPCNLPDPYYSASTWIGDRFITACGRDALQLYDPATDLWQKLTVGPSPMTTRAGAVVAWTGEVLIAWSGTPHEALNPTPPDGTVLALPE